MIGFKQDVDASEYCFTSHLRHFGGPYSKKVPGIKLPFLFIASLKIQTRFYVEAIVPKLVHVFAFHFPKRK